MSNKKLPFSTIQKKLEDGSLRIISYTDNTFYDVYDIYIDSNCKKYKFNGELIIENNKILSEEQIRNKLKDGSLRKTKYVDMINHDYYDIYIDENEDKFQLNGCGFVM